MGDALDDVIRAERLATLRNSKGAIILSVALVAALVVPSVLKINSLAIEPEHIEGTVQGFGSYADYEGDRPLITVALPDGSTRKLFAARSALRNCKAGSRISLIRRGSKYSIGLSGCREDRS